VSAPAAERQVAATLSASATPATLPEASTVVATLKPAGDPVPANLAEVRPSARQLLADSLEVALLRPLLASTGDAVDGPAGEGDRQADPPVDSMVVAEAETETETEAAAPSGGPARATADALLARRAAADGVAVADVEPAADGVTVAEAATAAGEGPGRSVDETADPERSIALAEAGIERAAPPAETTVAETTVAVAAPAEADAAGDRSGADREAAAPTILRGGEVATAVVGADGPMEDTEAASLFAQHGAELSGEMQPLDLTDSAPVRLFGRGPSVEVVTYILPAEQAAETATAQAGEAPAGDSETAAPIASRVAEAAFDRIWSLAAWAADDAEPADAPIESLVAESVFDEVGSIAVAEAGAVESATPQPAEGPVARVAQAPEPRDVGAAASASDYFVQVGAFAVEGNADRMHARVAEVGDVRFRTMVTTSGVQLTRVLVGPFASQAEAEATRTGAIRAGLVTQAMVVRN
jgi:cell division septation protein DedD